MTPMRRSLANLRERGYTVWVTETWNHFAKRKTDLFGCVDILAVGPAGTMAIQTTSGSNHSARAKKVRANENLPAMLEAGWVVAIQSWRKSSKTRKWVLREEQISL